MVPLTKQELKALGPAAEALCAANGGHRSGPRIPLQRQDAESARAWAKLNPSTRSGASAVMTPLTANPVPGPIAKVVAAHPHPLQHDLEQLIANDRNLDPFVPLDEPLNPSTVRFDPDAVLEYEVVGPAKEFGEHYRCVEMADLKARSLFHDLKVWEPDVRWGSARAGEHVDCRDTRMLPWLVAHVELHSRERRPADDADWKAYILESLRYVAAERQSSGISQFAATVLESSTGTRMGGNGLDFLGSPVLFGGDSECGVNGMLPRAAVCILGIKGTLYETGDSVLTPDAIFTNKCSSNSVAVYGLLAQNSDVTVAMAADAASRMIITLLVTARRFVREPWDPEVGCAEAESDVLVVPGSVLEQLQGTGVTLEQAEGVMTVQDTLLPHSDCDLGSVALLAHVPAVAVEDGGGGEWSPLHRSRARFIILFSPGDNLAPQLFVTLKP